MKTHPKILTLFLAWTIGSLYAQQPHTETIPVKAQQTIPNFPTETEMAQKVMSTPSHKTYNNTYPIISYSKNGFTSVTSGATHIPYCLAYNKDLNTVMFTHRKSPFWVLPGKLENSGAIQSTWFSLNGSLKDSVIVYADSIQVGRFPSGIIFNTPGNSNPDKARVIASGVTTNNLIFTGVFFASDSLKNDLGHEDNNVYQKFIDAATGDSLHFANADLQLVNGNVYVLAGLQPVSLNLFANNAGETFMGVALLKGTPTNAGINWVCTKFKPQLFSQTAITNSHLSFSPDGQTGYLVLFGILANASGVNRAIQPIVYKSTDAGNTWAEVNQHYNWNAGNNSLLMSTILPIYNGSMKKPLFNEFYGVATTVDNAGKLHLICNVDGGWSDNNDSLAIRYGYNHITTFPKIWDLVTDGTGDWQEHYVATLNSSPFFSNFIPNFNFWADSPFLFSNNRIQVARSENGEYIFIGWTDSDGSLVNNVYNVYPDIYLTAINTTNSQQSIIKNVTPGLGDCWWMQMAPTVAEPVAGTFQIPFVYSSNLTHEINNPVTHYYVNDAFILASDINQIPEVPTPAFKVSKPYPNPGSETVTVDVQLPHDAPVSISLVDHLGRTLEMKTYQGSAGVNNFSFSVNSFSSGIYCFSVKVYGTTTTQKIMIKK